MEADALVDAFYQLLIMGRCAKGKEGVGSQGQVHFTSDENISARSLAWNVYARGRCVTVFCSARCLVHARSCYCIIEGQASRREICD